jgi:hypothetical protein
MFCYYFILLLATFVDMIAKILPHLKLINGMPFNLFIPVNFGIYFYFLLLLVGIKQQQITQPVYT